jgi:hypothetical protein
VSLLLALCDDHLTDLAEPLKHQVWLDLVATDKEVNVTIRHDDDRNTLDLRRFADILNAVKDVFDLVTLTQKISSAA